MYSSAASRARNWRTSSSPDLAGVQIDDGDAERARGEQRRRLRGRAHADDLAPARRPRSASCPGRTDHRRQREPVQTSNRYRTKNHSPAGRCVSGLGGSARRVRRKGRRKPNTVHGKTRPRVKPEALRGSPDISLVCQDQCFRAAPGSRSRNRRAHRVRPAASETPRGGRPSAPSRLAVRQDGRVRLVRIEDYVLGSALAEVTPLNETPATVERVFEVQAVLARSFAVANVGRHRAEGFDLCDTSHCQLYEPERIRTSRFAAAAGPPSSEPPAWSSRTRTPGRRALPRRLRRPHRRGRVGLGRRPGALPSRDRCPARRVHRAWTTVIARDDLRESSTRIPAAASAGSTDCASGARCERARRRGRAHRRVTAGGSRRGPPRDRQSPARRPGAPEHPVHGGRASSGYTFRGTGFGHGVGLCQRGALARARRGESLARILAAYYQGASLRLRSG